MWVLMTLACVVCGSGFIPVREASGAVHYYPDSKSCRDAMLAASNSGMRFDLIACRNEKTGEFFVTGGTGSPS